MKKRELENLLAEKYRPKNANLKRAIAKAGINFYELKAAALKKENALRNLRFNETIMYLHLVAQRLALPALRRGRRSRPTRKMKRRLKLLEIVARLVDSPQRQVHALLGMPCYATFNFSRTRHLVDYTTQIQSQEAKDPRWSRVTSLS
ncbi:MAG: hypothetical protein U0Z26_18915 [Anaerolineales bacterium]